jgi:hypothetical protein
MADSIMPHGARQIKGGALELVHRKPPARCIVIDWVKDDLYYRWRYRGVKERSLAITYGIPRESVEEIIREKVAERTPTPAVALRKAA